MKEKWIYWSYADDILDPDGRMSSVEMECLINLAVGIGDLNNPEKIYRYMDKLFKNWKFS